MTTPIIILALLLAPWALFSFLGRPRTGGVIGLALSFLFFAVGHFALTDSMVAMLPPFVPFRAPLVYATGALEIGLAAGLLFPFSRRFAGLGCAAALVLFFPANIYAATNYVGSGGHQWGPVYLLIRGPLQALLLWWTWFFAIRSSR